MNVWKRVRNFSIASGVAALVSMCGGAGQSGENKSAHDTVKVKTEAVVPPKVAKPVKQISYKTDTLSGGTNALMYFLNGDIVRNYVENNNTFRMQLRFFSHEEWHAHNYKLRFRSNKNFSPEQYYRLCFHDEISANIAELLTARYEYLASKDKASVIAKYANSGLNYYFNEIKAGRINPENNDAKAIEAEYRFIANETRDYWMKHRAPAYAGSTYRMLQRYIKRCGKINTGSDKAYNDVKSKMYVIGGVDFGAFMDKDIDSQDNLVAVNDAVGKVECLKSGSKEMLPDIEANYRLLKNVPLMSQGTAFQHVFISARMKYMLRGVEEDKLKSHPQIITSCYNKIVNQMKADISFKNMVKNMPADGVSSASIFSGKTEFDDAIKKMYTFNGVNLTEQINDFHVDNVPVISNKYLRLQGLNGTAFLTPIFSDLAWQDNLEDEVAKLRKVEVVKSVSGGSVNNASQGKKRISKNMTIRIPNFYEPILVNATDVQRAEIFDIINEFEAIPEVLKSCNTKEINKYKQVQSKKNISQLRKNKRVR